MTNIKFVGSCLSVELMNRKFIFTEVGGEIFSKDFIFGSFGIIQGHVDEKEVYWNVNRGIIYIMNKNGLITWKSEGFGREEDGSVKKIILSSPASSHVRRALVMQSEDGDLRLTKKEMPGQIGRNQMTDNLQITRDFLVERDWTWGALNEGPLSVSFRFGEDGFIEGYKHENEFRWETNNGILEIFDTTGNVTWSFSSIVSDDERVTLISTPKKDKSWKVFFGLTAPRTSLSKVVEKKDEGIRLVIWDLDDTFWKGTLSEEGISIIQRNVDIVNELNSRGIVNSICSRNSFEDVQSKLKEFDLWDKFVFPRISWYPKGPQVLDIVEKIQLRPETILFIDDNVTNLNEVKHFLPNINVSEPTILVDLLQDARFKGKPDPDLSRLERYRVLEAKHADIAASGGDNEGFLRKSNIRVSFHTDIEENFFRIHDLVNRTNQLNFTKNRWPEDIEAARKVYLDEVKGDFGIDVGYVKVSDNYGNYGICGFYLSFFGTFKHFLFSCRSMNMGVEQFVWRFLREKDVPIRGEVASSLESPIVDWISIVPDADLDSHEIGKQSEKLTVCLRGACDLMQTANFMRKSQNLIEEFNYGYGSWEIVTTPRIIHLHEDLKDQRNIEIIEKLPGMPRNRFDSAIITEEADVYVLSFSQETFHGLYKSRSTGMIIPMGSHSLPYYHPDGPTHKFDLTAISYAEVLQRGMNDITPEQWHFFCDEFEFMGGYNENLFLDDVDYLLNRLLQAGKLILVLGLNDGIGQDRKVIEFFGYINKIIEDKCHHTGIPFLSISHLISSEAQLADDGIYGGTHFNRLVYKEISDLILAAIRRERISPMEMVSYGVNE